MAFRVEIEPQAFADLDSIARYIRSRSSFDAADSWFTGIMDSIASLARMPARCPVAAESQELGREVRVLLHGRRNRVYKVYFSIRLTTPSTGTVTVLHVRHWARKPLTPEELESMGESGFDEE